MNLTYSTIKYFWRNLRIWLVQNKAYIEASVWWNSFFNEMTSFCCCSCFHGLFSFIYITSLLSNTFWCYVLQRWRHIYTRTSFIQWTREILFSFSYFLKRNILHSAICLFFIWTDNRPGNEWNTCSCLWARVLHSTNQQTCAVVPTWGRMGLPLDWQAFSHSFL